MINPSTAFSIALADGTHFSATNPQAPPLLSINVPVPIGLQFGETAGSIRNQSQATNSSGERVGLQVPPGKTLALVGGDVTLAEGGLTAAGGRIELGSVAGVGQVSLSQTGNSWALGYNSIDAFGDIRLEGGSLVDASGEGGGDVQIQGAQLEVKQGSFIVADTLGAEAGKEVLVHTTEAIALSDGSGITANVSGSGTGGDLRIETGQLTVRDGSGITANVSGSRSRGDLRVEFGQLTVQDEAHVATNTSGTGNAGNLTIRTSDSISFDGLGNGNPSGAFSVVAQGAVGNGGDIDITTGSLSLTNGAQLLTSTLGQGDAGSVSITATDTISLDGVGLIGNRVFPSGVLSLVRPGAVGNGGGIDVKTGSLSAANGAHLSADTNGKGNAGNVSITATDTVAAVLFLCYRRMESLPQFY